MRERNEKKDARLDEGNSKRSPAVADVPAQNGTSPEEFAATAAVRAS
jgi:hypothetical protein